MLEHVNLEEILFLDIETVPQHPNFGELDEDLQKLWEEKSRFNREKNELSLEDSYSMAGIYAEFGKIICVGVGYFTQKQGERIFRCTAYSGEEKDVLHDFSKLLEQRTGQPFRMLCAHNGKEFDFPYLCRRMLVNGIKLPAMLDIAGKKPWEVGHIDTMELWKFGDYKHYTSLKLLAKIFGIPTPKDDIDGSQVREVYYDEKNPERIRIYCMKDVLTIGQLFLKYRNEDLLDDDSIVML
jgi:predicted PolB exonuclease-like 3'-5' exonuclease